MMSALGSHRFNPLTGLWELVSLENATGFEMSLPMMAEVGAIEVARGLVADSPVTLPPEPVTPLPLDAPGIVLPGEPVAPVSPPHVIPGPDGLIIVGEEGPNLLEGGDGNDLVIAGRPPSWDFMLIIEDGVVRYGDSRDTLIGGLGQDTLIGNEIGSVLDGGIGADVMIGGVGDDFYWVDDAGDVVFDYGTNDAEPFRYPSRDCVYSSVSYILPAFIENLVLGMGAGDINGTGNEGTNFLFGNDGRNVLSGGAGDDWLNGQGGGDTLIGGDGEDLFFFRFDPYGGHQEESVIVDFELGVDKLSGGIHKWYYHSNNFIWPEMSQDGDDTILTFRSAGGDRTQEVRLVGIDMHSLSVDEFRVVL